MIEALKDPKTWMFAFFAAISLVALVDLWDETDNNSAKAIFSTQ